LLYPHTLEEDAEAVMGNIAYKNRHKEQGLCVQCSRPAIPGRILCMVHSESSRQLDQKRYPKRKEYLLKQVEKNRKRYRETNRCPMCSAPLGEQDEGYKNCVNCRSKAFHVVRGTPPITGGLLENYYKRIASQS